MSETERPLGRSGVSVPALGVGTNRWTTGEPGQARLNETLATAVDVGMGFFDTAEAYGSGKSERAVGVAARQDGRPVVLASKFAPLPARLTAAQFDSALDRTLKRLGVESLDLYYLHFPYSLRGVETWMKAMAKAVETKKIRAVGISNCNVAQMRKSADVLARYGIPLAANQVQYSLVHRTARVQRCPRRLPPDGRRPGRLPAHGWRRRRRWPRQEERSGWPCGHPPRSGGRPGCDHPSGGTRLAAQARQPRDRDPWGHQTRSRPTELTRALAGTQRRGVRRY